MPRWLVTTGLVDELPDVAGLVERWGRDVVHCPYCHGWEIREEALGVLGSGPMAVHQALLFRQWCDDVTLLVHTAPEPSDEELEQLAARGVAVVVGKVAGLEVAQDRLTGVRLSSGTVVSLQALALGAQVTARAAVLVSMGVETAEFMMGGSSFGSYVPTDPTGMTAVPGVWVAGNVTDPRAQVIGAAAAGVQAAAAVNADLIAEEVREAVAARRNERRMITPLQGR